MTKIVKDENIVKLVQEYDKKVLTKTNITEFTPTADYQPATKKYVDETANNAAAGVDLSTYSQATNLENGIADGSLRSKNSTKEGSYNLGENAISLGKNTQASGAGALAQGNGSKAIGGFSHAEGSQTQASGLNAHSEGASTVASALDSHAEGAVTNAASKYQHVQGKYNIVDSADRYAHIVGNGDSSNLSNAHTLDWDGNAWFAGDVFVGGTSQEGASILVTEGKLIDRVNIPMKSIQIENNSENSNVLAIDQTIAKELYESAKDNKFILVNVESINMANYSGVGITRLNTPDGRVYIDLSKPALVENNETSSYSGYMAGCPCIEIIKSGESYLYKCVLMGKTISKIPKFLEVNKNYSTPYNPKYPGSPATKKYVDDAIDAIPEVDLTDYYNKTEVDTIKTTLETDITTVDNKFGNYYNKGYIDNAISSNIKYEIVDSLPITDIDYNTIYFVRKDPDSSISTVDTIYNRYIYIEDSPDSSHWEDLGSTKSIVFNIDFDEASLDSTNVDVMLSSISPLVEETDIILLCKKDNRAYTILVPKGCISTANANGSSTIILHSNLLADENNTTTSGAINIVYEYLSTVFNINNVSYEGVDYVYLSYNTCIVERKDISVLDASNNTSFDIFEPTLDRHPVTKKYVDDFEYEGVKSNDIQGSILGDNYSNFIITNSGKEVKVLGGADIDAMADVEVEIEEPISPDTKKFLYIQVDCPGESEWNVSTDSQAGILNRNNGYNSTLYDENLDTGAVHLFITVTKHPDFEHFNLSVIRINSEDDLLVSGTKYLSINNDKLYTPSGAYNPATKKYVDDELDKVKSGTFVDLSGYYSRSEVDAKITALTNRILALETSTTAMRTELDTEVPHWEDA